MTQPTEMDRAAKKLLKKIYAHAKTDTVTIKKDIEEMVSDALSSVRMEALEEAAKVADDFDCDGHTHHKWDCCGHKCNYDIAKVLRNLRSHGGGG